MYFKSKAIQVCCEIDSLKLESVSDCQKPRQMNFVSKCYQIIILFIMNTEQIVLRLVSAPSVIPDLSKAW